MSAETSLGIGLALLAGILLLMALGSFVYKLGTAAERVIVAWRTKEIKK